MKYVPWKKVNGFYTKLSEPVPKTVCAHKLMLDIFTELGDGDGENGGKGSLWNCAPEIREFLVNGHFYQYADCEWFMREAYAKEEE